MAKAKKSKSAVKTVKKSATKVVAKVAPKANESKVGSMLRKARESAGISQEELAMRLKTKRTAISRIENHADDIKLSTLERIASALGKEIKVKIL
jgi:ribosome-binding protein aMBF1 (putative translation factor)